MSLSFIESKDYLKPFIKLEIHKSQICKNVNVPLPYGLMISFDTFPDKVIEPVYKQNEIFENPKNQFFYYFDNNCLNNDNVLSKEFIINSYIISAFILKKNFASVKIPLISYKNDKNQKIKKEWYFLKDINNNICIQLLLSIDINIPNRNIQTNKFNTKNNILFQNNKTIKENNINNISRTNTYYNHNTHLISTNYNSSHGNSLLNLTNNMLINNNNNLNISLPINFSPITFLEKTNSIFMDNKNKQMEKNMEIINNNLYYKNNLQSKSEQNLIKTDEDSIIINDDNDICYDKENYNNNKKLENKIKKLIDLKNKEIEHEYNFQYLNNDEYYTTIGETSNNKHILKKAEEKYKNQIKNFDNLSNNYKNNKKNLKNDIFKLNKNIYRLNILKELDDHEKSTFQNLNYIYSIYNNLDLLLLNKNNIETKNNAKIDIFTPKKAESFNKINFYALQKNKAKKNTLCINKTIPHNFMYIKKLNLPNKPKEKLNTNYITTGRNLINKKCSPINCKYKKFNTHLSSSVSSENYNNNEDKNKILRTEGKNNKNQSINYIKVQKIKIDKINCKRKSLKLHENLGIPIKKISNNKINNYHKKYRYIEIDLSKKTNLTITQNKNKKNIPEQKNKNNTINTNIIGKDINLQKMNNLHKNSSLSLNKDIYLIENISPNNIQMNKTSLNNNFGKKKLKLSDKSKNNNNNYEGNSLFIKRNNKKHCTIKNNTIRLITNPNEANKKKNIKFRNYLNFSGNLLLLNAQKPNKSTRENKRKTSRKKILLSELIK